MAEQAASQGASTEQQPVLTAEELAAQPTFQANLQAVASYVEEQRAAAEKQEKLSTDPVAVAAEIERQRQRRQEAIAAFTAAADQVLAVLERNPAGVPPALQPAAAQLLRFWHADAVEAAPARQLCREVQLLLDPAARAAIAAHLTDLHQRAAGKQPPFIAGLPVEAMGEGVTLEALPGQRTCRLLADQQERLVAGGPPPRDEVPGLPGGPLDLQALLFGLAVLDRQVPGLHPLSLTMLDAKGQQFVCCSVCGMVPCLEAAHMRLMTRKLADSIAQRLAELEAEATNPAGGQEAAPKAA